MHKIKRKIELLKAVFCIFLMTVISVSAVVTIDETSLTTDDSTFKFDFDDNWINIGNMTVGNVSAGNVTVSGDFIGGNVANWDTAYGWGDHSLVGYLTAYGDPWFNDSIAYGLQQTWMDNWNTSYTERGSQIAGGNLTWSGGQLHASGDINPFNQDLNTTDTPVFKDLYLYDTIDESSLFFKNNTGVLKFAWSFVGDNLYMYDYKGGSYPIYFYGDTAVTRFIAGDVDIDHDLNIDGDLKIDGTYDRWINDSYDNKDTLICNSNGTYWAATGANLQIAINDLGSDGGEITIPDTTIYLDDTRYINNSNITLIGIGNATLKASDGIDTTFGLLNIRNVADIHIEGITFDGNIDGGALASGIYIAGNAASGGTERVRVTDCNFYNTSGDGIYVLRTNNSMFDHNIFRNVGNVTQIAVAGGSGIKLDGTVWACYNNTIKNNNFKYIRGHAIKVYDSTVNPSLSTYNRVEDNNIRECNMGNPACATLYGTGIDLEGSGSIVEGNIIEMNAYMYQGILISGHDNLISNNHITKLSTTARPAIQIADDVLAYNNTITNNFINGSGVSGVGIYVHSSSDNIVSNNRVLNCYVPFQLLASSRDAKYNIITENVFGGTSIDFSESTSYKNSDNIFKDNSLKWITGAKISSSSGNNAMIRANNTIKDNIDYDFDSLRAEYIWNSRGFFWKSTFDNLQTAIYNLNSTNGGKVFFPHDTLTATSTLKLISNLALEGTGQRSIILDGMDNGATLVLVDGCHNVSISGINITGSGIGTSGNGISINSSKFVVVKDCWLNSLGKASDDGGVFVGSSDDVMVKDNFISNCRNGFMSYWDSSMEWCNRISVIDNTIWNSQDDNIHQTKTHAPSTLGNTCHNAGETDVDDMGTTNSMISGNTCYGSKHGIEIGATNNTLVCLNTIYDTSSSGLVVKDDTWNTLISRNSIRNVKGFHGIILDIDANGNSNDITVSTNIIETTASDCIRIQLHASTRGIQIIDNIIEDAFDDGIGFSCSAGAGFVSIHGNTICNNDDDGIQIDSGTTNITIFDNYFYGNGGSVVVNSGTNTLIYDNIGYNYNSLFPYYKQATPPTMLENTTAYWYNTTGGWLYQVANAYGTQYYINMSTTY